MLAHHRIPSMKDEDDVPKPTRLSPVRDIAGKEEDEKLLTPEEQEAILIKTQVMHRRDLKNLSWSRFRKSRQTPKVRRKLRSPKKKIPSATKQRKKSL